MCPEQNRYHYHQVHHTSLLLERLSIGCLLNISLYLRLPYCCSSSNKVVILNILNLFLNVDIVSRIHIKVRQVVWCLGAHTLPHQYTSLLSIWDSALHVMLQRFRKICLMIIWSATCLYSFRNKLKTYLFTKTCLWLYDYLFIWVFTLLSTLYRSYHNG